jgi:hypothetical protein
MTQFENFKAMTIDQLVEWLDAYGRFDESPWIEWFDETYCNKCPAEQHYLHDCTGEQDCYVPTESSWCTLNGKCKFFPDMDEEPDCKDIIKLWLESELNV